MNDPFSPHPAVPGPNRRRFLRGGAAAATSPLWFPAVLRSESPNAQLQHACIGVGGMGWGDLQNFLEHSKTQVVALCDVDEEKLAQAKEAVPGARTYTDWRELLEKEGDKIDSLNVSVPDHMHAAIALNAIRAGKHVYCQKPMCHDVAEVRALTEATRQTGVITQLGTQHASGFGDRMAVRHLRDGVVGKVRRVVLCSNRPNAIETYRLPGPRPEKGEAPPKSLHWDLWLGTAPAREFSPGIYHPTLWRAWQDFGTGWSGDIGCHIFDAVWKGLNLTAPKSVVAQVQESWRDDPARRRDTWPQSDHIVWIFPGNEMTEGDELTVEWFDGLIYPPEEVQALYPGEVYPGEAAMVIGTEGALLLPHTSGPLLLPRDKFQGVPRPEFEPRNHYHHFADACLGGEKTETHFLHSGPMTEAILLGTVAIRRPGQLLEWDHAGMRIPNAPEVESLLRRSYRDGWEVAGI
ncbi:MAG TPA: Gfo/Idh/MocA family oxidoreductase [Verrucomicrobiales bacterium]|nr:Gfo/Idh/MocA family oxidoreductase [Verrucomicrobiales bacterium]